MSSSELGILRCMMDHYWVPVRVRNRHQDIRCWFLEWAWVWAHPRGRRRGRRPSFQQRSERKWPATSGGQKRGKQKLAAWPGDGLLRQEERPR